MIEEQENKNRTGIKERSVFILISIYSSSELTGLDNIAFIEASDASNASMRFTSSFSILFSLLNSCIALILGANKLLYFVIRTANKMRQTE